MHIMRAEALEVNSEKRTFLERAREVGHNRLALAGAMLPPVMLTRAVSGITSFLVRKSPDWIIESVPVLRTMNEVLEGGMEAIGESKNILIKSQRLARALVGSVPSGILSVGLLAKGTVAAIASL